MSHPPRVRLIHVTAPGCSWSWGYEAVLQRVEAVYGDQVDVRLLIGCPYEDFDQWMRDYELSWDEAAAFLREGAETMGVPINTRLERGRFPWNVLPGSLAAIAARRQEDPSAARKFLRFLTRRIVVEGQDPAREEVLVAAAEEAGLDAARLRRDLADEAGVRAEYEDQGGVPHVPLGFYNLVLTDGAGRTVILDYAFDPAVVEGAIDYLAGGRLEKRAPDDLVGYARELGPTPLVEVARVFALPEADALRRLEAAEKVGSLERVTLAGTPHWRASGRSKSDPLP